MLSLYHCPAIDRISGKAAAQHHQIHLTGPVGPGIGDAAGVDAGLAQLAEGDLSAAVKEHNVVRQLSAAQRTFLGKQVTADTAGDLVELQAALVGIHRHYLTGVFARCADVQQRTAADQLHITLFGHHRHGIAPGTGVVGILGTGHLTVRRQQKDDLLARLQLGQGIHCRRQNIQFLAAQHRNGGRAAGRGLAVLVVDGHPGIADNDGIGSGGVGRNIIPFEVCCRGRRTVLVNVVAGAARQRIQSGNRAVGTDDDRRIGNAIAAGDGQEGQDLAGAVEDRLALGADEAGGGNGVSHGIRLTAGSHRALTAVHGGKVDLLAHFVAEQRLALAMLGLKKVQEQLGRLCAGQARVGGGDTGGLQKAVGLGLRHVALGPHAAHVLVLVAQAPHEDRHRLSGGHGLAGLELTVGKAGDDPLPRRHIDVGGRPVGGLHVREDGNGGIPSQLAAAVHGVNRHFAELCPVQNGVRAEGTVAVAVQHTHEPQSLHGGGGIAVADVGKFGDSRRPGRHRQQGAQHADRQQPGQNSFFHKSLSFNPPAGLPQAGVSMLLPPGSCRTARPESPTGQRPPTSPT